jgi:hypothetical protein
MFVWRGEDKGAQVKTFLIVARVAFIAAIALAAVTLTFFCLRAGVPTCAGRKWLEGYRGEDFMGLFLGSVWCAMVVGIAPMGWMGSREKIRKHFEDYDIPVLDLGSMQATFAMVSAYSSLLGMLGMSTVITGISVMHYHAVVTKCLAVTALN